MPERGREVGNSSTSFLLVGSYFHSDNDVCYQILRRVPGSLCAIVVKVDNPVIND